MKKEIKDLPTSVHVRLQNIAKAQGRPFQEIFYYYAIERFLFRLSRSQHEQEFVLKGGLAFQGWGMPLRRPTRDIDVQGYTSSSIENLIQVVKDVCNQHVEADGLRYDVTSVYSKPIMDEADYQGIRVYFDVYLGRAQLTLHTDFSFSNAITPKIIEFQYPTLLEKTKFSMRGYPPETSIAEKCEAMVKIGIANDRMKDFFDIWLLSQQKGFFGPTLTQALVATFNTRKTSLPETPPVAFSEQFVEEKQATWNAFLKRSQLTDNMPGFIQIIEIVMRFLWPPLKAAAMNQDFKQAWLPGGPWKELSE